MAAAESKQFLLLGAELYLGQTDLEILPTAVTLAVIKRAIGVMILLSNVVSNPTREGKAVDSALQDLGDISLYILLFAFPSHHTANQLTQQFVAENGEYPGVAKETSREYRGFLRYVRLFVVGIVLDQGLAVGTYDTDIETILTCLRQAKPNALM